ncbi:hypothetical protein [Lentzea albidocapillata]|uniref:Uncharacterized protein n=1 Tax=Lentzea albidocapillata TaxID=40571 RepID=A0A1W1ZSZ9_9PSEU|nr:hypothetical protein [Lentzea albidocapillata]SMC51483.1 hypothetical protein SAMN05660733_00209 [Lentzea albidocapillata]
MDFLQLGGPIAAVVTAFLSFFGARRMIRHERAKEELRHAEQQRAEEMVRQRAADNLVDQARAAVVAERDQLLGRWQQTLDEAQEERRRLVEDHRVEIERVRQQARWEVDRVRRESAAIVTHLRAQFAERLDDRDEPQGIEQKR